MPRSPGRRWLRRRGFTLIELLIVMAIISTLSTIGFVYYKKFIEETKTKKAISDVNEIANLIEHGQRIGLGQLVGQKRSALVASFQAEDGNVAQTRGVVGTLVRPQLDSAAPFDEVIG